MNTKNMFVHTQLAVTVERRHSQWCSGEFSLVGTLTWHYGHIPYRYQGGGGWYLNKWSFMKDKSPCSKMGV